MALADGSVLPKPGIPKTLGILNVIFGVLIVFSGCCMMGLITVSPAVMRYVDTMVKTVEAREAAQRKSDLKAIDDRANAAKTEEEKKPIEKERQEFIAKPPRVVRVDMSFAIEPLKDPVVMAFNYFYFGTGAILGLSLLIAGIGLIRMAPWGRTTSITWAILQILQLVIVTALSILYVQPIQKASQEKMLAKAEGEAKLPGANPGLVEGLRIARVMSSSGVTSIIALSIAALGAIYPVVVLILLSNPGAKAALQGPKPLDGTEI